MVCPSRFVSVKSQAAGDNRLVQLLMNTETDVLCIHGFVDPSFRVVAFWSRTVG